jgi:tRNA pseudouridine55 synthase
MDGILVIDKPAGITSHDVVARVRRVLKTRRVGHTGTLDPFATGVLVVLVGRATRLAQFLDKDEKEYEAVVRFGFETDTGDVTGMRSAECGMRNEELTESLNAIDWDKVLNDFRGEIEQVPPMYSAKKVAGKKLYEHARKGETIDRPPVRINVYELEMVDDIPLRTPDSAFRIRVVCSAGTYIRTLAEDIGRAVGVGAHVAELRRTRAGRFELSQSITLDDLEKHTDATAKLIAMDTAVGHLPSIALNADRADKTRNGLSTRVFEAGFVEGKAVRMLDENGELLAVGFYDEAESSIRPKVVLV